MIYIDVVLYILVILLIVATILEIRNKITVNKFYKKWDKKLDEEFKNKEA